MSQIIATTLSNGSVSVPTATVVNGSAKAWSSVNTNATVRDSFNIASVTDTGTGEYRHTLTSAMFNVDYSIGASCAGFIRHIITDSTSASVIDADTFNNVDARTDANHRIQVFGDLA